MFSQIFFSGENRQAHLAGMLLVVHDMSRVCGTVWQWYCETQWGTA